MSTLFHNQSEIFTWVILPLLIFLARICDVSIGTLRLIFLSKGFKAWAPVLGFFEVIIWILAISQILQHLDNVACYIAYGGGFAMGNYIGIILEEKLSLGTVIIRIIAKSDSNDLINYLKTQNYGLTIMNGEGSTGPVKIIFSTISRQDIPHFVGLIKEYNPNSFYTIEDVKIASEGIFKKSPIGNPFYRLSFWNKKR
jgi:uncharacterized protein YebE (UPF0316 family)